MKTQHLLAISTVVGAFAALTSSAVLAQQNTFKLGYANVQPNSSASDVSGPFTPSGLSLEVRNKSTPVFGFVRQINDTWDVEFALGIPPTHDVGLKVNNAALPGSAQALNGQIGARVRQVAPTLFANYKFLDKSSAWRPFIGVGINYTKFDKADSAAAGNTLNGGATSLSLEDSVGLALQAGVTYRIDNQWSLSASVATAQVKTKLTTNTYGIQRTADITFKPTVFALSVGYSF
jgi:outer membrane protein